MLQRLASVSLRRPRLVIGSWVLVMIAGFAATGMLFSSLDGDLDSPSSYESEQVWQRLDELAPSGASMAAIVEGGQVSDAKVRELEGIDGVESVQAGPSADGEVVGVGIELAGNLSDGEEEETAVCGRSGAARHRRRDSVGRGRAADR